MYQDDSYYIENIFVFWEQLQADHLLYFLIGALFVTMAVSVAAGMAISKFINPVSRSLADVTRTVIVWVVGVVITVTIGEEKSQYKLESLSVVLNICKLLAFLLVIYGTLLYHDILVPGYLRPSDHPLRDSILES